MASVFGEQTLMEHLNVRSNNVSESLASMFESSNFGQEDGQQKQEEEEETTEQPPRLTINVLREKEMFSCIEAAQAAAESATVNEFGNSRHSDTASSESPDPQQPNVDDLMFDESASTADFLNAVKKLQDQQKQEQMTLLDALQKPPTLRLDETATKQEPENINATIRDILNPQYTSPWVRNAGRKKSHPVWDFFRDLKDSTGIGGVICLHCTWTGEDRSPNNLRTHLKKFHTEDGIFSLFNQKLAKTPTQPYVKRSRAQNTAHLNSNIMDLKNQSALLHQLQQQTSGLSASSTMFSFLENLPKSAEVINISAGFGKETEDDDHGELPNEAASSSASEENGAAPMEDGASPTKSSEDTNNLNALFSMAANNPIMMAMISSATNGTTAGASTTVDEAATPTNSCSSSNVNGTTAGSGGSFTLNDGHCAATLMSMAIDLEMTMSYHRRRVDIEFCFESNKTAEKSGGRGKVICLIDMGKEIRIVERLNGQIVDTELWTKTDFNQFHWAIRGKCQQTFNKH